MSITAVGTIKQVPLVGRVQTSARQRGCRRESGRDTPSAPEPGMAAAAVQSSDVAIGVRTCPVCLRAHALSEPRSWPRFARGDAAGARRAPSRLGSWPGTLLLYGAAAVHVGLALWKLVNRRTWRMPPWEAAQIALGLWIRSSRSHTS